MNFFIKNISLLISLIIVIPIGFIYGFNPDLLFDIHPQTINEHHFNKAVMGIYIGFSILWLIGIFKYNFWQVAIVSNFIFMFGLAFGRLIGVVCDGIPTLIFVFGIFGEFALGFYSLMIWKKYQF